MLPTKTIRVDLVLQVILNTKSHVQVSVHFTEIYGFLVVPNFRV